MYSFELKESDTEGKVFLFTCRVEGGTYIRKICSDLGDLIGGAHMGELRRTAAGIFTEKGLFTLTELDEAIKHGTVEELIIPAEEIIRKVMEVVEIHKQALLSLLNGKPLFAQDVLSGEAKEGTYFAAFFQKQFVGVYRRTKEKRIFGRPEFVYSQE